MKRFAPWLAVCALAGPPGDLVAQDTEWNRYTLEGLGGVFLRSEVAEACEATGFSMSALEAEATTLLIESEVQPLTRDEMLAHPALPELRVNVDCAHGTSAVAYSVEVRVQQSAKMLRDEQVTLPEAVTWFASTVGISGAGDAASALEGAVRGKIQEFVAAYVAANAEDEGGG